MNPEDDIRRALQRRLDPVSGGIEAASLDQRIAARARRRHAVRTGVVASVLVATVAGTGAFVVGGGQAPVGPLSDPSPSVSPTRGCVTSGETPRACPQPTLTSSPPNIAALPSEGPSPCEPSVASEPSGHLYVQRGLEGKLVVHDLGTGITQKFAEPYGRIPGFDIALLHDRILYPTVWDDPELFVERSLDGEAHSARRLSGKEQGIPAIEATPDRAGYAYMDLTLVKGNELYWMEIRYVATCGDPFRLLARLPRPEVGRDGAYGDENTLRFSPDGTRLLVGWSRNVFHPNGGLDADEPVLQVFDLSTGEELVQLGAKASPAHPRWLTNDLVIVPDLNDRTRLLDLRDGSMTLLDADQAWWNGVLSPDGRLFAYDTGPVYRGEDAPGDDSITVVIDAESREEVRRIPGTMYPWFLPDGTLIVSEHLRCDGEQPDPPPRESWCYHNFEVGQTMRVDLETGDLTGTSLPEFIGGARDQL